MFFVLREFRRSWIILAAAGLAALYTYIKQEVTEWPEFLDTGINTFVTASSGILAFVLSFQLSAALGKSAAGIAGFNSICGDLLAFAMHIVSLSNDDPAIKNSGKFIQAKKNVRDLLLAAPGMFKWRMRKAGVDIDLVQVKQTGDASVKLYERNEKMYCLLKRYMSIGSIEALMLALSNELHTIRESGALDPAQETVLMAKWEGIYGAYGGLTGVAKPPPMLDWFLYITLAIYVIFMPYEFADMEYHGIYLAGLTAYFYLGLWIAGTTIGDPFREGIDPAQFETVTGAAKGIQDAIEEMFKRESELSLDDDNCEQETTAITVIGNSREPINSLKKSNLEMDTSNVNYVSTHSDDSLQTQSKRLHW